MQEDLINKLGEHIAKDIPSSQTARSNQIKFSSQAG